MNKIILTGRLTRDVELKTSEGGSNYCKYTIAVYRDKDNADFIDCITFGTFAVSMSEYIKKGDMLGIEGKLQINTYEKDGVKHQTYSVVTERVEFLSGKAKQQDTPKNESIKSDTFEITDDDLPF